MGHTYKSHSLVTNLTFFCKSHLFTGSLKDKRYYLIPVYRCMIPQNDNKNLQCSFGKWTRQEIFACNVTSRHVRVTMLLPTCYKYYICWLRACSLNYPACNAHAPYYIFTCGMSVFTKFFTLPRKRLYFLICVEQDAILHSLFKSGKCSTCFGSFMFMVPCIIIYSMK